jgi:hypothetical protein
MGGERKIQGNIRVAPRSPRLKRNSINHMYDLTAQLGLFASHLLRILECMMHICTYANGQIVRVTLSELLPLADQCGRFIEWIVRSGIISGCN